MSTGAKGERYDARDDWGATNADDKALMTFLSAQQWEPSTSGNQAVMAAKGFTPAQTRGDNGAQQRDVQSGQVAQSANDQRLFQALSAGNQPARVSDTQAVQGTKRVSDTQAGKVKPATTESVLQEKPVAMQGHPEVTVKLPSKFIAAKNNAEDLAYKEKRQSFQLAGDASTQAHLSELAWRTDSEVYDALQKILKAPLKADAKMPNNAPYRELSEDETQLLSGLGPNPTFGCESLNGKYFVTEINGTRMLGMRGDGLKETYNADGEVEKQETSTYFGVLFNTKYVPEPKHAEDLSVDESETAVPANSKLGPASEDLAPATEAEELNEDVPMGSISQFWVQVPKGTFDSNPSLLPSVFSLHVGKAAEKK